jgi:hypothetical protein
MVGEPCAQLGLDGDLHDGDLRALLPPCFPRSGDVRESRTSWAFLEIVSLSEAAAAAGTMRQLCV